MVGVLVFWVKIYWELCGRSGDGARHLSRPQLGPPDCGRGIAGQPQTPNSPNSLNILTHDLQHAHRHVHVRRGIVLGQQAAPAGRGTAAHGTATR